MKKLKISFRNVETTFQYNFQIEGDHLESAAEMERCKGGLDRGRCTSNFILMMYFVFSYSLRVLSPNMMGDTGLSNYICYTNERG